MVASYNYSMATFGFRASKSASSLTFSRMHRSFSAVETSSSRSRGVAREMATGTEICVCVLGLSRGERLSFHSGEGVGKSCLCYRLMHPGHDEYVQDHPSLLALHEFESSVINNDHFVYWGSSTQVFARSGKERPVAIHVVENTVFYEDVTSLPFNSQRSQPDDVNKYVRRAIAYLESPGKVSYCTRDSIGLQDDSYQAQQYPSNINSLSRGYLIAVDVSLTGVAFDAQMQRVEKMLPLLRKKKGLILVATKRDNYSATSLEILKEFKKKQGITLIETSAHSNYNVAAAFRAVAAKVVSERVEVPSFEEAAQAQLLEKTRLRGHFRDFLKKFSNNSSSRLAAVNKTEEYKKCRSCIGNYETNKLFALHLLELRNREMYAGAYDDPERREEFLEEFVEDHPDFTPYKEDANK